MIRETEIQKVQHLAEDLAEERILDALLPQARSDEKPQEDSTNPAQGKYFVRNCVKASWMKKKLR
ncbi:MAG: hypothetical protein CM1200mP40_23750 [Gammaproteobacteria bacterium]|nr:MAG: hypothetical protein CM1200mP40_23750 [Gammaproteobacteria bacterium]